MQRFTSFDGTTIAYLLEGEGPDVLLLHGFAADHEQNWVAPHVVEAVVTSGRRVIAPDARGHGASDKPHDPAAYSDGAMRKDVHALLDHLGVSAVDVVGYSMGSMVASEVVPQERRARSLVLGGVGHRMPRGFSREVREGIAQALLAEDPKVVDDRSARAFGRFAQRTGADRVALAAIQRAERTHDTSRLAEIAVPTLVLTGADDALVGDPHRLAELIPGAQAKVLAGDHLTAVYDPAFRESIVAFLG